MQRNWRVMDEGAAFSDKTIERYFRFGDMIHALPT